MQTFQLISQFVDAIPYLTSESAVAKIRQVAMQLLNDPDLFDSNSATPEMDALRIAILRAGSTAILQTDAYTDLRRALRSCAREIEDCVLRVGQDHTVFGQRREKPWHIRINNAMNRLTETNYGNQ